MEGRESGPTISQTHALNMPSHLILPISLTNEDLFCIYQMKNLKLKEEVKQSGQSHTCMCVRGWIYNLNSFDNRKK